MYAWDEHDENYLSLSNIYSMFICLLFCFYHNIDLKQHFLPFWVRRFWGTSNYDSPRNNIQNSK